MDTTERIQLIRRVAREDLIDFAVAATLTGDWSRGVFLPQSTAQSGPDLHPGDELVQRYRIDDELGRGGFGVVHQAEDRLTGERVAVKSLLLPDPKARERLRREAAVMRLLHMPGVVAYLDEVTDGDTVHLVTQLVDGVPFPGPLPRAWTEAGEACIAVLETLCRVHDAGVIHRDIKPANVLVTRTGRPFLLDFGIAAHERLAWSDESGTVGTPWYFAPELFLGQQPTELSDLYAVALMLLEGLTGRLPGEEGSFQALLDGRMRGIPTLRDVPADVPDEVRAVLAQCLHPDPAERPADVATVVQVLRRHTRNHLDLPLPGRAHLVDELVDELTHGAEVIVAAEEGVDLTPIAAAVVAHVEARGGTTRVLDERRPAGPSGQRPRVQRLILDHLDEVVLVLLSPTADDAPPDRWVERWTATDLAAVLHGPDALFHLREDGARVLAERTLGIPDRVVDEVGWWVRADYGVIDDGHLRLSPAGLDHLRSGLAVDPAARSWGHDGVDPLMGDVLRALALAAHPVPSFALAAALEVDEDTLRRALRLLVQHGIVRVDGETVTALTAAESPRWSGTRRLAVRRRFVEALPHGSPGRFVHLLVLGEPGPILEEANALLARYRSEGLLAEAWAVATEAHVLASRHGRRAEAQALLAAAFELALERALPSSLRWVENAANHAAEPALARFANLAGNVLTRPTPELVEELAGLPPLPEVLDGWRWSVRSFAAMGVSLETQEAALRDLRTKLPPGPLRERLVLAAEGRIAYSRCDFAQAALLRRQVQEHPSLTPLARVAAMVNTTYALLETGDLDATAEHLATVAALVARERHPSNEAHVHQLMRTLAYRQGRADPAPQDLFEALELLGVQSVIEVQRMVEAAYAYRSGDRATIRTLAAPRVAQDDWSAPAALVLALGVDAGMAVPEDTLDRLLRVAERFRYPGITVQVLALLTPHLPDAYQGAARRVAGTALATLLSTPGTRPHARREVLTIEECVERLGASPDA
ncbi:MAG: serine/threonine protein kinase [Alphaproteobacteria bacterium]|nr:serine/threonine protein kinase [Alphaproteobacteria bacterium]